MSRNVIIHLPHVGEDFARWAVADEDGKLVSAPLSGPLSEAAVDVDGRKAILVLRGDTILLTDAVVPGGSAARAQQAVPYALEEQLADDVDALHFALGAKGAEDRYPVAVIGRETMQTLADQCSEAGLRPSEVVPETLAIPCLPAEDDDVVAWTALHDNAQTVVRLNGHEGFATDDELVGIMLDGARSNLPEGKRPSLVVFSTDPDAPFPALVDIPVETRPLDNSLALYASGLAKSAHINLLQGEFSPKKNFDKTWRPWRWTAGLAAAVLVALFALVYQEVRQLESKEAALDARIESTFKSVFPNKRMQRPTRQMQAALNDLGGGGGGGFSSSIFHIAESLATQPQTELRSITYRNGRIDLDVNTDALPTLDALKSEMLNRGGLNLSVQSANREDRGVRARLRIE